MLFDSWKSEGETMSQEKSSKKKGSRTRLIFPLISFAFLAVSAQSSFLSALQVDSRSGSPQFRTLSSHVPRVLADTHQVRLMQAADESIPVELSLLLSLNHEAALEQLLAELYRPQSPLYQKYLSTEEFRNRFAPNSTQLEAISHYLLSHGIEVQNLDANGLVLHARGSVGAVQLAFQTRIVSATTQAGRVFLAPAQELRIPEGIQIAGVFGINGSIELKNHIRKTPSLAGVDRRPGVPSGLTPQALRDVYRVSKTTRTGKGQKVALFTLANYNPADITAYTEYFHLPAVPLTDVIIDGAGNDSSGADETTLDLQMINALAPGLSEILVYQAPNSDRGVINLFSRIASDNQAKVISSSWGDSENQVTAAYLKAENTLFQEFAAQGQALYVASGNNGAYDDGKTLSLDDPSSNPLVIAVGGTRVTPASDGSWASETTWNTDGTIKGGGSGGGVSRVWPIPAWQSGVLSPQSLGSRTMRNSPDVALVADPNPGLATFYQGKWQVGWGGTSYATPLWAAFHALVDEARTAAQLPVLGFLSPRLYQLAQSARYSEDFHDIADRSTNLHYPAVTGLDLATGWGSFVADALLEDLSQETVVPSPSPTPAPSPTPVPTASPQPSPTPEPSAGLSLALDPSVLSFSLSSDRRISFKVRVQKKTGVAPRAAVHLSLNTTPPLKLSGVTSKKGIVRFKFKPNPAWTVGVYGLAVSAQLQAEGGVLESNLTLTP